MALEPSGNASSETPESGQEVPEISSPARAHSGFAEAPALFRSVSSLPPELAPLEGLTAPAILRWAALRADALGIGGDEVLKRSGAADADTILTAYAAETGIAIDWLEEDAAAPLDHRSALAENALHARPGMTVAVKGRDLKTLAARIAAEPNTANTRITTRERLERFIRRTRAAELANDAAFGLLQTKPGLSAGTRSNPATPAAVIAFAVMMLLAALHAPRISFLVVEALLAATFLAWAGLRILACLLPGKGTALREFSERELPIYTILVPLHREAGMVADLVRAISALNYPREKLDVKLILEEDDLDTIASARSLVLDPCFEIVIAPQAGPRTKPKALQAALPFARGEYLVVFDAEDRPEPDQLRIAYARFCEHDSTLACVQARLATDNARQTFFTEHFRAEYAGLFEVLLPALARFRLPLPLGGTSNHFRTASLRAAGGWDPHNVTEDADLGVRLARFGYTTDVIASTTFEEAPASLSGWLPQRTRWMKGWLQTYLVHMRNPALLMRQLGARNFFAFQLLIGGTVLAALVHPFFVCWIAFDILFGSLLAPADTLVEATQKTVVYTTLISGYLASAALAAVGLRRRGTPISATVVFSIPLYWLFLSAAAWRALWKLLRAPHEWEKTEHGIAARISTF